MNHTAQYEEYLNNRLISRIIIHVPEVMSRAWKRNGWPSSNGGAAHQWMGWTRAQQ